MSLRAFSRIIADRLWRNLEFVRKRDGILEQTVAFFRQNGSKRADVKKHRDFTRNSTLYDANNNEPLRATSGIWFPRSLLSAGAVFHKAFNQLPESGWQQGLLIGDNLVIRENQLVIEETYIGLWKANHMYFVVEWSRGAVEATVTTLDLVEDVTRKQAYSGDIQQVYNSLLNQTRPLWGCETPQAERRRIAINCAYQDRERAVRRHYNPLEDWW